MKKQATLQPAHALLSASGAHRWLKCTPSAVLASKVPDVSSEYAEQGTLAHELAFEILSYEVGNTTKRHYEKQLRRIKAHKFYDADMLRFVKVYTNYVLNLAKQPNAIVFLEKRLDFSAWVQDSFGTADAIVYDEPTKTLHVIDLKFGLGVKVHATHNPQLKMYALGAYHLLGDLFEIDTVCMTITQPRIGEISSSEVPILNVIAWGYDTLIPTAKIAYRGEGEQTVGEHCKFCRVQANCKKFADQALNIFDEQIEKYGLVSQSHYVADTQVLLSVYEKADLLKNYLESVKEEVYQRAIKGEKIQGYVLRQKESNRAWTDDEAVLQFFKDLKTDGVIPQDEITEKVKPIGIGKTEKLLNQNAPEYLKQMQDLTTRSTVLALVKDDGESETPKTTTTHFDDAIMDFDNIF